MIFVANDAFNKDGSLRFKETGVTLRLVESRL